MSARIQLLRKWLALTAALLVLITATFLLIGRMQVRRIEQKAKEKLGVEVQSSTSGFTLSKSEAGRTIFTVHAARAVEYKQGGRAELRDVSIILYGKDSTRFDQIYGAEFIYDPRTGEIRANGLVEIDLEANSEGPVRPDQSPPRELKNPIHLKTSGLVFNQKTGFAATRERIEFHLPRASGSAVGASFDSKTGALVLDSQVAVRTTGDENSVITAQHAVLTKFPRQAVLDSAKMEAPTRTLQASKLTAVLRQDNSIERLLATGGMQAIMPAAGPSGRVEVRAPQGDFAVEKSNHISSGVLSGGVTLDSISGTGKQDAQGSAGRINLLFGANNRIAKVQAFDNVHLLQRHAGPGSDTELIADQVDAFTTPAGALSKALTKGAARIELVSAEDPAKPSLPGESHRGGKTIITAGTFHAVFGGDSRIKSLHGEPDAKIVSSAPGQPDRVSTSRALDVTFNNKPGSNSGIESVLQQGGVHIVEGDREAFAQNARYTPADETLSLAGSPRVNDPGTMITAESIRMNRVSGDAVAENDVKTTYTELKEQPQGALLAAGEPIHVTAKSMVARRATGTARYSGGARLWQGANIVQAQVIEFNRDNRSVNASGRGARPVTTVLVQTDKNGRVTPVNITSARLTYNDLERTVHFDGGVVMKTADGTLTADRIDAFLLPRSEQGSTKLPSGASQLNRAVASGAVDLQQPGRNAKGEKLVYTSAESKYVLTGSTAKLPTLSDVAHGNVTGDSLTFYSRDDRVVVGSASSARTVTQTHVPKQQ